MKVAAKLPETLELLKEAVEATDGCSFELVDTYSCRLAKVAAGDKVFYPSAVKIPIYPLNSSNAAELVTDKAYTNLILDRLDIARTEGEYFYARPGSEQYQLSDISKALAYANSIGYPVFCKPNRGAFGNLADVCFEDSQLAQMAKEIAKNDYLFHVQKVYTGREFRAFCVDGEIQFGYERLQPIVAGDGVKTIEELIDEINKKTEYDIQRVKLDNNFLTNILTEKDLKLSSVLQEGEKLQVSAAANIARGGQINELIKDNFSPTLIKLAEKINKEFNIRVFGIDYFASSFSGEDAVVIEINQNPSLKGIAKVDRQFAIGVWKGILEKFRDGL